MRKAKRPLPHVGWREMVRLPAFGDAPIMAKLDTGAFTSALHATGIEHFTRDGQPWARFLLDLGEGGGCGPTCEAPVVDRRAITSSNGVTEERCIITTQIMIGDQSIETQFSLADRSDMKFPILIGRTAIKGRFLVDSDQSFLQSRRESMAAGANKDTRR